MLTSDEFDIMHFLLLTIRMFHWLLAFGLSTNHYYLDIFLGRLFIDSISIRKYPNCNTEQKQQFFCDGELDSALILQRSLHLIPNNQ